MSARVSHTGTVGLLALAVLAVLSLAKGAGPDAGASDDAGTIAVSGVGEAPVSPDQLVVRGWLEVESEVAEQALEKLRNARAKAAEKLDNTPVPNLVIRFMGPKVSYGEEEENESPWGGVVVINGRLVSDTEKVKGTRLVEEIRLQVRGLDGYDGKLLEDTTAQLVDGLCGAGVRPGLISEPSDVPLVVPENELLELSLTDLAPAEHAAFDAALAQARRRAEQLAGLSGRRVRGVRSITVVSTTTSWHHLSLENLCRAELAVVFEVE